MKSNAFLRQKPFAEQMLMVTYRDSNHGVFTRSFSNQQQEMRLTVKKLQLDLVDKAQCRQLKQTCHSIHDKMHTCKCRHLSPCTYNLQYIHIRKTNED